MIKHCNMIKILFKKDLKQQVIHLSNVTMRLFGGAWFCEIVFLVLNLDRVQYVPTVLVTDEGWEMTFLLYCKFLSHIFIPLFERRFDAEHAD